MGAAARAEGDATPGGELAQLVESLAGDGDATAAAALRFSKDDKARPCSSSGAAVLGFSPHSAMSSWAGAASSSASCWSSRSSALRSTVLE